MTLRPTDWRHDSATHLSRSIAFVSSGACAFAAAAVLGQIAAEDGLSLWDGLRIALILVTTLWLAWGAAQAFLGLVPRKRLPFRHPGPSSSRTAILLPICNEDPLPVFARVAAMDRSVRAAGLDLDIVVLSDTGNAGKERAAFAMLLAETQGAGRIFYRNRTDNHGRKAGNIEEFLRNHGGAYDFAVILDADSLMEGATIRELIARMESDPSLGLLQTLPRIVGARSIFGRAQQFAASFYAPFFARGLARLQGDTGPFWGHNAIVRVRAMAECCGLPVLRGAPPFGGTILSHDYVEAALLARGGWRVEVDETIGGSFEEGPEDLIAFARRDRRWCQGNLQHIRLLGAPGLRMWSRFVFLQGILSYIVPVLWAVFLLASVMATVTAPPPDYFPEPFNLFPVFPDDKTRELIGLIVGIGGLLLGPKLAIFVAAVLSRRTPDFGGIASAARSTLAEVLLSTLVAPIMLVFQSRAVAEVFAGHDGGWPATRREGMVLTLAESWAAGKRVSGWGLLLIVAAVQFAPELTLWLLPVAGPMIAAPALIAWTSQAGPAWLFTVPEELDCPPIVEDYRRQLERWVGRNAPSDLLKDRFHVEV